MRSNDIDKWIEHPGIKRLGRVIEKNS